MKRYKLTPYSIGFHNKWEFEMVEHPQGEYVKYSDGPQWVSVRERLPERDIEVLVALKGCMTGKRIQRTANIVKADDHNWESDGFEIANCWDITHWMPLPNPPEESDDE